MWFFSSIVNSSEQRPTYSPVAWQIADASHVDAILKAASIFHRLQLPFHKVPIYLLGSIHRFLLEVRPEKSSGPRAATYWIWKSVRL